jgi:hypothetical protein
MIIWIASYPKSGNTWVRSLLSAYLNTKDGKFTFDLLKEIPSFPSKKSLNFFLKKFNDIKEVSNYWIAAQDRINLNKKTTFLKTHSALCTLEKNPFTNRINTKAVIYIVRDPRNIITSISNHFTLDLNESYNFMINKNKMLTGSEWGGEDFGVTSILGSWSDHYVSWKSIKFAPFLIVKYEDLIRDTKATFINIINFLSKITQISVDEKKILNTVESCSFKNLKKMENEQGFFEAAQSKKNDKKVQFFNLGKKNNWNKILDKNMENKLRQAFIKEMRELGYI